MYPKRTIPPRYPIPTLEWRGHDLYMDGVLVNEKRQRQAFRCATSCGCMLCDACLIGIEYYNHALEFADRESH